MFLGVNTANLIARWLIEGSINVTHLLLTNNNIMDDGVHALAKAISINKSLVAVDLSHNSFTPRCAQAIFTMLATNQSIISLNLGSEHGS